MSSLTVPGKPFRFTVPTLDEVFLSELKPASWVLPRRLAKGDIALIGGPPFSGKSWVMAELAISWAAGLPAFDWAPAFTPQKVLWIDEETSAEEAWSRARAIIQARGVGPERLRDTLLYPLPRSGFTFSRPETYGAFLKLVENFKPDWCLFDSLVGVLRLHDENKSAELRNVYNDFFKTLSSNHGCGLLFLHHTRKRATDPEARTDYADPEMLRIG